MSEGICYIVAAGERQKIDFVPGSSDLVIAADAGIKYLAEAGIKADIALGDFDSLGQIPDRRDYSELKKLNVMKDNTDTQAAIETGLARGYRNFYIYCATGGKRIDHTVANLQSLIFLAQQGARGYIFDRENAVTVIKNTRMDFNSMAGKYAGEGAGEGEYFSVFAVGGPAKGVNIKGFMYELENAELTPEYPLGVSNEFTGKPGFVSVEGGMLMIIFPQKSYFYPEVR